jgi:hypothetical protein
MSMKECIDSYSFRVSEKETQFRDLFGKEELTEARKRYYAEHNGTIDYLFITAILSPFCKFTLSIFCA